MTLADHPMTTLPASTLIELLDAAVNDVAVLGEPDTEWMAQTINNRRMALAVGWRFLWTQHREVAEEFMAWQRQMGEDELMDYIDWPKAQAS